MRAILFCFIILTLASCSNLTPFTKSLYEQHRWDESDLQRIQFYLSDDIVLRRDISSGSQEIINGDIKIIDGKQMEVITIPKRTPGVMEFTPDKKRIAVRFEEGGERYLMFGANPKYSGKYMLLATEWSRSSGKVRYEGTEYRAVSNSQLASLMVDLKKIGKTNVNSRTADGVKINKG